MLTALYLETFTLCTFRADPARRQQVLTARVSNLARRDADDVLHPLSDLARIAWAPPMMIRSGEGICIRDDSGREHIDVLSGLRCTSLGYSKAEVAQMQARLSECADHPLVGETRGMGMIGTAELAPDKARGAPFPPEAGLGKYALARAKVWCGGRRSTRDGRGQPCERGRLVERHHRL